MAQPILNLRSASKPLSGFGFAPPDDIGNQTTNDNNDEDEDEDEAQSKIQ